MIDVLKSIGIEKGKTFNPDAKMKRGLTSAVTEAHEWLSSPVSKLQGLLDSVPFLATNSLGGYN